MAGTTVLIHTAQRRHILPLRRKIKHGIFSARRAGVLDLGMGMIPCCTFQRSKICAGVLPYLRAKVCGKSVPFYRLFCRLGAEAVEA